jgi:VanZ family protein
LKAFLRYWLPIFVWMTLIFMGSTDLLSAEHTSRIIEPFLRWLHPGVSPETVARAQFFIRKAGHVSEYAVLAALFYRALVNTLCAGRAFMAAVVVLLACAAYAATDEFHQSFVPSRTASARDVAIDISGALVAVCLYSIFCLGRQVTTPSAVAES